MANWHGNNPPMWVTKNGNHGNTDAVMAKEGWINPRTGEILVAVSNLDVTAGAADPIVVSFLSALLAQGDPLAIEVKFNELVDVTAGDSIVVASTGATPAITLYAVAQHGVYKVRFDKKVDLITPEVVPAETAVLSVAAQSILGTIVDDSTPLVASNLAIPACLQTRSVA